MVKKINCEYVIVVECLYYVTVYKQHDKLIINKRNNGVLLTLKGYVLYDMSSSTISMLEKMYFILRFTGIIL